MTSKNAPSEQSGAEGKLWLWQPFTAKQKHLNLSSLVNETSAMSFWFAAIGTRQSRMDLCTQTFPYNQFSLDTTDPEPSGIPLLSKDIVLLVWRPQKYRRNRSWQCFHIRDRQKSVLPCAIQGKTTARSAPGFYSLSPVKVLFMTQLQSPTNRKYFPFFLVPGNQWQNNYWV